MVAEKFDIYILMEELYTNFLPKWYDDCEHKFKTHPCYVSSKNTIEDGKYGDIGQEYPEAVPLSIDFDSFLKGVRAEIFDVAFDEAQDVKFEEVSWENSPTGSIPVLKDGETYESSNKFYPDPSLPIWKYKFNQMLKNLFSAKMNDMDREKVRLNIITVLCDTKTKFEKYTGKELYMEFMKSYIDSLINGMEIFKPAYIDIISSIIDRPLKLKVEYGNKQLAKLFVLLTDKGIIDINNVQKLDHLGQVIASAIEFKNEGSYHQINTASFKKEFNSAKSEYYKDPKKFGDFNLTL